VAQRTEKLYRGDFVEIRSPNEISSTLDGDGAVDHLPFMPEMLEYCGKRFRVSSRAAMVCFSGAGSPRGFRGDDVVTLDGVRCSGAFHDGCQKACTIFWREAWLRKADDAVALSRKGGEGDREELCTRLKTSTGPKRFYCQAGQLAKAADPLSRWGRIERYFNGFFVNNFTALEMVRAIGIWLFWKIRKMIFGIYARGTRKSTPVESLNLQPGEWVVVKSMKSIIETLSQRGQNRGLSFSPDMRLACGRRFRVKGRIDKLIVDGTGEQRQLQNTVCLEGSTCGCAYLGFGMGGCSRCEVSYWREIWLDRADGP
jgi:hypothetical protein